MTAAWKSQLDSGGAGQKPRKDITVWPASAPSRLSGIGRVKGHNQNEISFPGSSTL
jgi:hypothetical protein